MLITDIVRQVKNTNRYSIFIDGEFAFGISGTDLLYYKLEIGNEIPSALYERLLNNVEFTKARDCAVRYLGYAPRSRKEILTKLESKGFSQDNIQRAIEMLTKNGYIDDAAFAAMYISHKSKINNFGKRKIVAHLIQKGVSKKDILAAYAQQSSQENESEKAAAVRALEKKLRGKDLDLIAQDPKAVNRYVSFLVRRGFSYDVIKQAVAECGIGDVV